MDGLKESNTATWPCPRIFAGYISLLDLVSRSCFPQCLGVEDRGAKPTNPSLPPMFTWVLLLVSRQILGSELWLTVLS